MFSQFLCVGPMKIKQNKNCLLIGVRAMVFNATFNNISVISWRSVFVSGGNLSIGREQPTSSKSLTNFIT